MKKSQAFEVQTHVRGRIPEDASEYAREKVQRIARHTPEPVLYARVKLTRLANPAVEHPAIAQANLDLNGRLLRAHATAPTIREAVDLMIDRLRMRVERMSRDWEALRGGRPVPEPHEWRHAALPARRPPYFPRPPEERQVVRHKAYTLARETPDEAVFDMEALDYDFHLFTEIATGQDSVVYRSDGGYRLAQLTPRPRRLGPLAAPLTVSEQDAPKLSLPQAIEKLNLGGLPFVFFAATETRRGNVLYHRYDGHYGLIVPAE